MKTWCYCSFCIKIQKKTFDILINDDWRPIQFDKWCEVTNDVNALSEIRKSECMEFDQEHIQHQLVKTWHFDRNRSGTRTWSSLTADHLAGFYCTDSTTWDKARTEVRVQSQHFPFSIRYSCQLEVEKPETITFRVLPEEKLDAGTSGDWDFSGLWALYFRIRAHKKKNPDTC